MFSRSMFCFILNVKPIIKSSNVFVGKVKLLRGRLRFTESIT